MTSRCLVLLAALTILACGDDTTDPGTDAGRGTDAGAAPMDAGDGASDAGDDPTDAGDGASDAGDDAGDGTPDAGDGALDGGDGTSDAGTATCTGKLGEICNESNPCDTGEECVAFDASGDGVCAPATAPICGGFAGATCPASAPICLMHPSASGWPCATATERDCICSKPAGRARFPSTCGAP